MPTTNTGLDSHAYQGAPQGFRRSAFPNGEPIEHPSKWNREHWSFDEELKTRAKNRPAVHVPISTDEALKLLLTYAADLKK